VTLWQKAVGYIRRALSLTNPDGWLPDGGRSNAGETVSESSVLGLSAGWACVNLIAGTIGSLPLMVYRTNAAGDRAPAKDHPLYRVLHDSPNADQTALDFWEGAAASLELKGNALAEIERAEGGRVIAITPVAWDVVAVRRDQDGVLVYSWGGRTRAQGDVLHIRGFGGAPEGGMSTLAYGRHTFGLAQAVEKVAGVTFANGIRPSGVLKFKEWLKADQRDAAKERLETAFRGAMDAGKPLVLEGGVEWTPLTMNLADAQLLQSRGLSIEDICRYFGVPPIMIGHGEKTSSWGTGVQEVTQGFVKYTLRRRLKRIEQALEKQLLTAADRAAGVRIEFSLEGLLRGDSAARSSFYQSALTNGWMTINEVRALENLAPVEGGAVPRMQSQNTPITAVPGPRAAPALPAPGGDA